MPKFSHSLACLLDSHIRNTWHNQKEFGLSKALNASSRMKKHDSSSKRNEAGKQLVLV